MKRLYFALLPGLNFDSWFQIAVRLWDVFLFTGLKARQSHLRSDENIHTSQLRYLAQNECHTHPNTYNQNQQHRHTHTRTQPNETRNKTQIQKQTKRQARKPSNRNHYEKRLGTQYRSILASKLEDLCPVSVASQSVNFHCRSC